MRALINEIRLALTGALLLVACNLIPDEHPAHDAAMDAFRALGHALGKT